MNDHLFCVTVHMRTQHRLQDMNIKLHAMILHIHTEKCYELLIYTASILHRFNVEHVMLMFSLVLVEGRNTFLEIRRTAVAAEEVHNL